MLFMVLFSPFRKDNLTLCMSRIFRSSDSFSGRGGKGEKRPLLPSSHISSFSFASHALYGWGNRAITYGRIVSSPRGRECRARNTWFSDENRRIMMLGWGAVFFFRIRSSHSVGPILDQWAVRNSPFLKQYFGHFFFHGLFIFFPLAFFSFFPPGIEIGKSSVASFSDSGKSLN